MFTAGEQTLFSRLKAVCEPFKPENLERVSRETGESVREVMDRLLRDVPESLLLPGEE
jgi:hypothetical protein